MALLLDLAPLREHPAYRRLFAGYALANVGAQLTAVAASLQVYALTRSTAAVGLAGLFALVPLVVMGLYGGALIDHHDRRVVGLVAQTVMWAATLVLLGQALLGNTRVLVLYLALAVGSGAFAIASPARSSIYPRILPRQQLPAANALSVFAMNSALTAGPLLAGFLIGWFGFKAAYAVDGLLTTAALLGLASLPPVPPEPSTTGAPKVSGVRAVWDGLAFLGTRPNVRMTFVADIIAMMLAAPRVLFPAAGAVYLGGGSQTVGALYAAAAVGGLAAMVLSGPLGQVRRQGLAILVAIVGWGVGVAGLGVALLLSEGHVARGAALVIALAAMFFAGACDAVSAVFRQTILQSATPDHMRGRLQGVFIVVVAGGPRLGDLLAGGASSWLGEPRTALIGGLACVAAIVGVGFWQRGFVRYDALDPTP